MTPCGIPLQASNDALNSPVTLCWGRLKAGGEGEDRVWDGWIASPTQWTWVWASSRRWWRTRKPGMLQSMGLQRVGRNWATELNWTDTHIGKFYWQLAALMAVDCLSPFCSCPGPCHCDFSPGLLQNSNLSPYCHTLSHLFSMEHPEISFRTSHNMPFLCLQLSGYVLADAINQENIIRL